MRFSLPLLLLSLLLPTACAPTVQDSLQTKTEQADAKKLEKIGHIIVVSLENHSFDNIFGHFPGANGVEQASHNSLQQTDKNGVAYAYLPAIMDTHHKPALKDQRFPSHLDNNIFAIETYVAANEKIGDLVHRFYQEQLQIHDGKMDRFATISDAGGLTMGYYDGSKTNLWKYASNYTLADNFFHAAFGGSFLNHFWLVCACTPIYEQAPQHLKAVLGKNGELIKDGAVTPDGYAINTLYYFYPPHPINAKKDELLPPQTLPTIGDRLSEKGINWAWYAGGWNDALAGRPHPSFQFHHQPLAAFQQFADSSSARKEHLQDEQDFLLALKTGKLPPVSFYKPLGEFNLHPGYADMASGDAHLATIMDAIQASPVWADSVVIIVFDENGGFWDHVAPPSIDRWGAGTRIPAIIVSPFAKKHFVDHTQYDTTSILKLIESRHGLKALTSRDASANNLLNALE